MATKRTTTKTSTRQTGTRGRVKAHTRTVNGKKVHVKEHRKHVLNPGRAGRNAKRAYRAGKRKRHAAAFAFGALAVGEVFGWAALRGSAVGLTLLGAGIVGLGLAARSLAR